MAKKTEEETPQMKWPTVERFTKVMRQKLEENEEKKGSDGAWRTSSLESLLEHLRDEVEELGKVVRQREHLPLGFKTSQALHDEMTKEIAREAADVANLAMMVADVVGELGE